MPATMQSVTTRGYGISGGFTGDSSLVVTLGYGIAEAIDLIYGPGMWAAGEVQLPGWQEGEVQTPGWQEGEVQLPGFQEGVV